MEPVVDRALRGRGGGSLEVIVPVNGKSSIEPVQVSPGILPTRVHFALQFADTHAACRPLRIDLATQIFHELDFLSRRQTRRCDFDLRNGHAIILPR